MQIPDIEIQALGQVGFRYQFGDLVVYIDPYLSNSVEKRENSQMRRLVPVPLKPEMITDADCIFITHEHRDHCDEDTILAILQGSPRCLITGPGPVCDKLRKSGIHEDSLVSAGQNPIMFGGTLQAYPVPSAHPEIEVAEGGGWTAIGYVFDYHDRLYYHAGDTSLRGEIIDAVKRLGDIDTAFLPVNEKNYYKDLQNIIGNMTIREAFYMAESINARVLVPTHWDMFTINQVFPEEIELLYNRLCPDFELNIMYSTRDR
jgi:L-ascorbate metabolism protein UlaG (beta-lactamase superfamily)